MISPKFLFKAFPWFLLIVIVFTLYLTHHWPFTKDEEKQQTIIESTTILEKIEALGKLELVKYNFKEVFEYKQLSDGKVIGNSIIHNYSFEPDLSVLLIASGEAVGCIDLRKININDITTKQDTIILSLPPPELCYYKLDLENTRLYSFSKESWWSKLFSSEEEKANILQLAYQQAEKKLKEAAIESGIYQTTNENTKHILQPILEELSGMEIKIITSIPDKKISPEL